MVYIYIYIYTTVGKKTKQSSNVITTFKQFRKQNFIGNKKSATERMREEVERKVFYAQRFSPVDVCELVDSYFIRLISYCKKGQRWCIAESTDISLSLHCNPKLNFFLTKTVKL